jgi:ABC-three component (ABC-3C) system Middle Component 6
MILPTKRLGVERAMLTVGAEILGLLTEPKAVSRLWDELGRVMSERSSTRTVNYDWFVLTLDLLYLLGALEMDHGRIRRINQ